MYFADLSEYRYGPTSPRADHLNIGWLARDHIFPQRRSDPLFVARLGQLVRAPVNLYRGHHICEFCPPPPKVLSRGGIEMYAPSPGTKGNGEVHVCAVRGGQAITYVAPVLVFHYVAEHRYLPPQEFIDAVNSLPL